MKITNEIDLHEKSLDYLNSVFTQYTEIDRLPEIIKNPIIHMYPKKDTYNYDGELDGYIDALFFELCIYDTDEMTVWKSKRLHDAIIPACKHIEIGQIKAFKDLSTMIVLNGHYTFSTNAALSVLKV
ncbi:hypothetical protein [Brevibacillus porteri]|uniref:hypothetical protein n=1 Tax=Brevibacillus porteri TaxID=2126350 RepID=UPI003639C7C0